MAELNLKQITDKLNAEFSSDGRKLVFWYDAGAEFINDIDTLGLDNAKVLKLEKNNQFYIKLFLEREDTETNYLIYAPFPKPHLKENHLSDTIRYSKEFFADRASLVAVDLKIDEKYKPVLQHYIKFFGSKERLQKFYELEIENFNKKVIETALMSVICKTKVVSFEEILRTVLTEGDIEKNKYLSEFEKYDLISPFWDFCKDSFGYSDESPSLIKLIYTLFTTYTSKVVSSEIPSSWKNYCSHKSGNAIAFLDSLMNSMIYRDDFDTISDLVFKNLDGDSVFKKLEINDYAELEIFRKIDSWILSWMIERLENKDLDATLNNKSVPEICKTRRKMHFGKEYLSQYYIIENAYNIVSESSYKPGNKLKDIWDNYIKEDYIIDQRYRYFYYHYDKINDTTSFENIRELVENIYTNCYINPLTVAWNEVFINQYSSKEFSKQTQFYNLFLKGIKERVVVIISDALRYEVGQTLFKKLMADEKCTAEIKSIVSVLPSYTKLGMSALLPHDELSITDEYKVEIDGNVCDDLKSREKALQKNFKNRKAVQFDEIKNLKITELKEIFTGQELVYVYHNQIDARGDKLNTENEVFNACEEAIEEIHTMIRRLTSANNIRYIITSDHGFIYKRDKLDESDKISDFDKKNSFVSRRYVISNKEMNLKGTCSIKLGDVLDNNDERILTFPLGTDVIKMSGGGQNFVHGGSSLQEVVIPVIDVKTTKYYAETKNVTIALVSLVQKITNLTTNLDFIQSDAVTDVNKETTYKVYFISGDNEKISNDCIYVADKKETDASKRVFRLKFNFKNKKYDKSTKYFLVALDEKSGLEVIRHEVQMDLAFTDDFGFNS